MNNSIVSPSRKISFFIYKISFIVIFLKLFLFILFADALKNIHNFLNNYSLNQQLVYILLFIYLAIVFYHIFIKLTDFLPFKICCNLQKTYPFLNERLTSSYQLIYNEDYLKYSSSWLVEKLFSETLIEIKKINFINFILKNYYKYLLSIFVLILLVKIPLPAVYFTNYKLTQKASTNKNTTPLPIISFKSIKVVLNYPDYLKKENETYLNKTNFLLPEGTNVFFNISLSASPTKEVSFINNQPQEKYLTTENINKTFTIKNNFTFFAKFFKNNFLALTTPVYDFKVIKDSTPAINITYPAKDIEFTSNNFNLSFYAEDNHSVEKVFFVYKQGGNWKNILIAEPQTSKYTASITVDLSSLNLNFDSSISYYLLAQDNNPFYKELGRSKIYQIYFPKKVIYEKEKLIEIENLEKKVSEVIEEQKLLQKQYENLTSQINNEKKLTPQIKEKLNNLIKKQQDVWQKVNSLKEDLNLKKEEMEKIGNTEVLKKIVEMQDLLNNITSPELKKALKELQNSLNQLNINGVEKNLLFSALKNKDFLNNLKQGLSLLKKIRKEEQLKNLQKNIQDILKEQKNILQATISKKEKTGTLAYKQHQLVPRLQDMKDDLKKTSSQINSKSLKDLFNKIEKQSNDNLARQATNELAENNLNKSAGTQKKIVSNLQQLNQDLEKLQKKLKQQSQAEIKKQVNSILQKGLYISQKEEEIIKSTNKLSFFTQEELLNFKKDKLQQITFNQNTLAEQTFSLSKELQKLSSKSLFFTPKLSFEIYQIAQNMQAVGNAIDSFEINSGTTLATQVLYKLNLFLNDLLKAQKKLSKLSQTKMYANYLKDLTKLAKMQQQMYEKAKSLMQKLNINGSGDKQNIMQQLQQLALQQQALSMAIEQMLGQMQKEGMGNINTYNSLGNASKQAKEIEKELKAKNINQGVLQKQLQVKQKLLEAKLSLKNQGEKENRESQTAKEYKIIKPSNLINIKINQEKKIKTNNFEKDYLKEYETESINYEKLLQNQ